MWLRKGRRIDRMRGIGNSAAQGAWKQARRAVLLVALLSIAGAVHSSPLAGVDGPLPIGRPRGDRAHAIILPAESTRPGARAFEALTSADRGSDRASRIPPGLAFLMSAALPGSGQLAEGRNRAFAYRGLEAAAWIAHFSWKDAGNKKEGEYEAYARGHWDLDTWNGLASESGDSCRALPSGVSYADAKSTIETFLEDGNYQHFYEDIGKLEAYRAGWDDFECSDPEAMSPNRGHYRGMRRDSNDYLNRARSALTFTFLNRVISAVDAYRTARGARFSILPNTDLRLEVGGSMDRPRAILRIQRDL